MTPPFHLKIISISDKAYKRQLLVTPKDVFTLQHFLKDLLKRNVMIVNTNIGVDFYYRSEVPHDDLIVSAFLLLATTKGRKKNDFIVRTMNNEMEIAEQTKCFFNRIINMPLLFKSYSRSMLFQIENNYEAYKELFNELFLVWQKELLESSENGPILFKVLPFIRAVQQIFIRHNHSYPAFQKLLEDGLSNQHIN